MTPLFDLFNLNSNTIDRYKKIFRRVIKWLVAYAVLLLLLSAGGLALSVYNFFQIRNLQASQTSQS